MTTLYQMTDDDLRGLCASVINAAAKLLRIANVELSSTSELAKEIEARDAKLYAVMTNFLRAWETWFQHCKAVGPTAGQGADWQHYAPLMKDRDEARSALIIEMDDIRFSRP